MTTPDRPSRWTGGETPPVRVSIRPAATDLEFTATPTSSDELGDGGATRTHDRASLTVIAGERAGARIELCADDVIVGRGGEAGVHLADTSLSRRHARFFSVEQRYYVEDLGSTNGTFVGGRRIDAPVALRRGDLVQLGPNRILMFNLEDAAGEAAATRLYESTVRDPTTGAFNRRHFEARLETEKGYALHHGVPLVLLVVDVDGFKSVNDAHGHLFGDSVLRVLAASVQRLLKPEDTLVRYGGDEFAVLCRDTSLRNGLILAERIRAHVEELPFAVSGNDFRMTVSVGVAGGRREECDWSRLVDDADRAMYTAKSRGRNAVSA